MAEVKLRHPTLGNITGIEKDGVKQFFGIQYATLQDRLAEPQLKTEYDAELDATKYGPAFQSPPQAFENEVNLLIQQPIPKPELTYSDTDALNLNVTVPQSSASASASSDSKLPVFVWIHGGGFILGANSWPHYDHAKIVALAARNGVPVIGVGINFRLGLAGLLTSEELRAAGYKANNLLRDQRTALRWVQRYIDGFGGDPDNVTFVGESAGAMGITLHLLSLEPLFQRVIAMGGSFLFRPPLPPAAHEGIYQQATKALALDGLPPAKRIEALLTIPTADLITKVPPSVMYCAMVDGETVTTGPSYDSVADPADTSAVPGKQWLKSLLIGDSQFDASVLYFLLGHLKPLVRPHFAKSVRRSLAATPSVADDLLALYGFTAAEELDEDAAFVHFLHFVNDLNFYLSTLAFASGFSAAAGGSYAFFFNERNPWPGRFQGEATHVLDVAFLFQNFDDKLDEGQKRAAQGWALDLCRFVSGQEPWEGFGRAGKAKVYGPSGGAGGAVTSVEDARGEGSGRRVRILEIVEALGGVEKLRGLYGDFMSGKGFS